MNELLVRAKEAAAHAHAPYSGYPVGAALMDLNGNVWTGCNVENASYGLSVCAERNAIAAMVAGGGRHIQELLVVTRDAAPPCGACLQVIREFTPDPSAVNIHLADAEGVKRSFTLGELLPVGFTL